MSRHHIKLPEVLNIGRLVDPVLDDVGFPWYHPYLEHVWLAHLGPTPSWLYRRLASLASLASLPVPTQPVEVDMLSRSLGLVQVNHAEGTVTPQGHRLGSAVARLVRFGFAGFAPVSATLSVRTHFAPAFPMLLARRTPDLLPMHERLVSGFPTGEAALDWANARAAAIATATRPAAHA